MLAKTSIDQEPGQRFIAYGELVREFDDKNLPEFDDRHWRPVRPVDAALGYAKRGWHVFPAKFEGKIKKSYKSAKSNGNRWGCTTDAKEIERNFKRWRKAGVGIAMKESDIFVIEADTLEGGHKHDGIASLRALVAKHGKLPKTRMAISPTGSLHFFLNYPKGGVEIKNSASEIAPGVDVRGEGGMVFTVPTHRPGKGWYGWLNVNEIADAPKWLIELCSKTPPREKQPRMSSNMPPADLTKIDAALAVISSDKETEWFEIGCALAKEVPGDAGLKRFIDWSAKSDKFDAAECRAKWAHCGTVTGFNKETIFFYAKKASPGWWAAKRHQQIAQNIKIGNDLTDSIHPTILTVDEMTERLVFVGNGGAIVDRETGRVRKKDIAGDEYAASMHITGKAAVQALKVWMHSTTRLSVDVLAWAPGSPQFCAPPETSDGARTAFNTWRGLKPMPVPKNWKKLVRPFLDHVAFLVPIKEERVHFLQWLAHIVQHPEVLPHTAYLFITPTTGIGRNLLASILVRALRGHVAANVSLPELLDGGYNGRLGQKLLATVDELKEGHGEGRYRRQQKLNMIITEEHRHINPKYGIQSVEKNCCRWLMFSNHADALPFDNSDRRVAVIDNPVKRKPKRYYKTLYGLLGKQAFVQSVRKYLGTLDISNFNPGEHAPMNKAKEHALNAMMTETDRAVCEFMDECKTELVPMKGIREHVKSCDAFTNNQHLNHAIMDAGMTLTHRRVKVRGTWHSVVIVEREKWTIEKVKTTKPEMLIEAMGLDNEYTAAGLQ